MVCVHISKLPTCYGTMCGWGFSGEIVQGMCHRIWTSIGRLSMHVRILRSNNSLFSAVNPHQLSHTMFKIDGLVSTQWSENQTSPWRRAERFSWSTAAPSIMNQLNIAIEQKPMRCGSQTPLGISRPLSRLSRIPPARGVIEVFYNLSDECWLYCQHSPNWTTLQAGFLAIGIKFCGEIYRIYRMMSLYCFR